MPTTKNSQQKGSRARGSVTGEVQKMHRIGEKEILHESVSVGVCVSEKMSAYGMSWKELGLEGRRQVVVNKDQQQQLENMQMQGEKSATVRICVCVSVCLWTGLHSPSSGQCDWITTTCSQRRRPRDRRWPPLPPPARPSRWPWWPPLTLRRACH